MFLRPFLRMIAAALSAAVLTLPLMAKAELRVTDILGREVTLAAPAKRIVLGEGRHMAVLGLLLADPVERVVGWRLDKALDPPTLAAYRAKFPAIDAVQSVGAGNRALSVEATIALDPDLVVLSKMDAGDPNMDRARDQLAAAGIAVAYVDFFAQPQENSLPSLQILGKLTASEDKAAEFAAFYTERIERIRARLADPDIAKPSVFFHVHAAPTGCCATAGAGVFNDFITTAGGRNIATEALESVLGNVSLEFLIGADPDFYIATGGSHMRQKGGLVLGSVIEAGEAAASFAALRAGTGFSSLRAVEAGQSAGVWHLFNDTPSHIALIEYLAKTFHPDLFADVDPDATLAEIERRFSPVAVRGIWWIAPEK